MTMATIIGRGHSGTRAMSHTLTASGFYMGAELNISGDLVPAGEMYEACRVIARYVEHRGGLEWDFSRLFTEPIDPAFTRLVGSYLWSVLSCDDSLRGWKLPETVLALPWMLRMFPDIHYIYWVRDPRDCILSDHLTDDLSKFGIQYPATEDLRERRAISWKYQYELMKATPRPRHCLEVRFEDFVLDQERTLKRIGEFLGADMATIPVKPEAVGRWKSDADNHDFDFFAPCLRQLGYIGEDEAYEACSVSE